MPCLPVTTSGGAANVDVTSFLTDATSMASRCLDKIPDYVTVHVAAGCKNMAGNPHSIKQREQIHLVLVLVILATNTVLCTLLYCD